MLFRSRQISRPAHKSTIRASGKDPAHSAPDFQKKAPLLRCQSDRQNVPPVPNPDPHPNREQRRSNCLPPQLQPLGEDCPRPRWITECLHGVQNQKPASFGPSTADTTALGNGCRQLSTAHGTAQLSSPLALLAKFCAALLTSHAFKLQPSQLVSPSRHKHPNSTYSKTRTPTFLKLAIAHPTAGPSATSSAPDPFPP